MSTMHPGARLIVVDDEPYIVELLATSLRHAGFGVRTAHGGQAAVDLVLTERPDLVVLDVLMPGMDGFAVVRHLRHHGIDVPVLFLTAKDGREDRVAGLTAGGDDYVAKPFGLDEVVARIDAILRRARPGHARVTDNARLAYADIELDEDSHEVWKAGHPIALSPTEFNLLRYLLANAEKVLSKAQILERVWSYEFGDTNVVESYVSYLRRKIDTGTPKLLHTVWGVGYVLRLPRDAG